VRVLRWTVPFLVVAAVVGGVYAASSTAAPLPTVQNPSVASARQQVAQLHAAVLQDREEMRQLRATATLTGTKANGDAALVQERAKLRAARFSLRSARRQLRQDEAA